jgi:hypothetical protein
MVLKIILFTLILSGCSTFGSRLKDCSTVCSNGRLKAYTEPDNSCSCYEGNTHEDKILGERSKRL